MALIFLTALTLSAGILVERLFRRHAIHSRLTCCATRSNTRDQTRFERLQRYYIDRRKVKLPEECTVVSFEFKKDAVILEVPEGASWSAPVICHSTPEMCRDAYMVSGYWAINSFAGSNRPIQAPPETPSRWRNVRLYIDPAPEVARLRLSGSELARQLDHQVASAVQDAELYFKLCSTPIWLRMLYSATAAISPASASALARRVLWIQLRTLFLHHDTAEYRGECNIFQIIYWMDLPDWAIEFETWSAHYIARQHLRFNSWIGHMFLGMRSEYPEYKLA